MYNTNKMCEVQSNTNTLKIVTLCFCMNNTSLYSYLVIKHMWNIASLTAAI